MDKDRVLDELHSTSAPNSVLEAVAEVYARAERAEADLAALRARVESGE